MVVKFHGLIFTHQLTLFKFHFIWRCFTMTVASWHCISSVLNFWCCELLNSVNTGFGLSLHHNYISLSRLQVRSLQKLGILRICMDFLCITGLIPFSLDNLRNLAFLYLSYNQINGSIPLKIWNLAFLYLSYNQINGSIPLKIWNLANLKALHLGSNNISGSIHITVGSLTQGFQFRSG